MSEDAKCNACQVDKVMIHALVTCTLNKTCWTYVTWLVKKLFHKHDVIIIDLLITNSEHNEIDDFITIAFWTVYKSIFLRNYKGVDYKESSLSFFFLLLNYERD